MSFELLVQLAHPLAHLPERQTSGSVGYDLTTVERRVLAPGELYLFDTGVKVAIPSGHYGRIAPRSGLAVRFAINVLAGVIDQDYRDNVKVVLINHSQQAVVIDAGSRVAQLILEKCSTLPVRTVDELPPPDQSDQFSKERCGGFGSTGTN